MDRIELDTDRLWPEMIPRTARKQWDCVGNGQDVHADDCSLRIEPGERYYEYVGETPAYQSGTRHSRQCALAFYTD